MGKKVLTLDGNGKKQLVTVVDNQQNAVGKENVAYDAKSVDNMINNLNSTKADKNGSVLNDFTVNNLTVHGTVLPASNDLKIGTPNNRFSSIYVDEAYLSTNTLYLGDTPVMGTDNDTIMIKSDKDQSITMKTTGVGASKIISESNVELSTSGANADVIVQATGQGARAVLSAKNTVDVNAAYVNISGDTNISSPLRTKSVTVDGDLVINGNTFTVNSTTVQTKDNIIELNYGQVGNGVSAGQSGIKVNRGDAAAYYMVFDEIDDMFKVGMVGNLETIASQKYVDSSIPKTLPANGGNADSVGGKLPNNTAGNLPVLDSNAKINISNIPVGNTATSVSAGNHTHNYDNYSKWVLKVNSESTGSNITSSSTVDIKGSGSTSVSRSGNIVTISSSDTNTASAINNILAGSNSGTAITYAPYTTQQSGLSFDVDSVNPIGTDRLNLNGYLYATKLYSQGNEVEVKGHTHANEHIRKHAITSIDDHSAGNWKLFYSNGTGQITELGLGSSGQVLKSNGASAAPTWQSDNDTTYTSLKNPFAITFTGGSTGTYDGSSAVSIAIPTALKSPNSLSVKVNDTNLYSFDGSSAKTLNIKAGNNVTLTNDDSGNVTINSASYTHPTTDGYKHIPSGGASGQFLKYSSAGTASWSSISSKINGVTYNANNDITIPSIVTVSASAPTSPLTGQLWIDIG